MHYSERMRRCLADLGVVAMHYSERMRSVWLILEWLPCTTVREWGESGWSWSGCHALQWENEECLVDLGVVAMHYSERMRSVWLILEWLPCTTVREWGVSGWSWSGCHALQWENEERLADLGVVAMHYSERIVWLILEWLPCTTVREWGASGWSWNVCHALQWENEESLADLGVVAMHYSERMRSHVWLILEWLPCTTVWLILEWLPCTNERMRASGWSWSGCHALQWENEENVWLILEWLPCTTVREWGASGWSWSGCHALQWENEESLAMILERLVDLGVVAMHYSERMRSVWLILEWLPCTTVREWGASGWSWSGCHALQWENEESGWSGCHDLGVVAMHYSERMRMILEWLPCTQWENGLILEWLPCTTVREWGVSGWSWSGCHALQWENESVWLILECLPWGASGWMFAMHYWSGWLILEWLPCTTVREWGESGWSWSGCHALQWENEERLADLGVVAMHYSERMRSCLADLGVVAMHYSERMRSVWLILEWLPCTTVREWGESGWSWSGCHALQWENEECLVDLGVVAMHYSERMRRVWLILEWLPCTTVREWGVWLSGWSWSGCHALQWETTCTKHHIFFCYLHMLNRLLYCYKISIKRFTSGWMAMWAEKQKHLKINMADSFVTSKKHCFQAFTAVSGSSSPEEDGAGSFWKLFSWGRLDRQFLEALLLRKTGPEPMLMGNNTESFVLDKGAAPGWIFSQVLL